MLLWVFGVCLFALLYWLWPSNATVTVTILYVYPIRSCGGFSPTSWSYDNHGFLYDRKWSIMREDTRKLMSQNECPRMALIKASISQNEKQILITAPNGTISVEFDIEKDDLGDDVSHFLSEYLKRPVRLIKTSDSEIRTPHVGSYDDNVLKQMENQRNFQYKVEPFLFATEKSLHKVEKELNVSALDMVRFRPNVVFGGTRSPFCEDRWVTLAINHQLFHNIGECIRCTMPHVNPSNGLLDLNVKSVLIKHHHMKGDPLFGVYFVPENKGIISINDVVTIMR
jgi:uncharacterized protein YcbX